jgi:hypothetical protein
VDDNWSRQTPEVQATRHGNAKGGSQRKPPLPCPDCGTEHNGECYGLSVEGSGDRVYDDGKDADFVSQDGVRYAIRRISKGRYEALVGGQDGERIKLGTHGEAYWACVDDNWSRQTPEVQARRHGTVKRGPQSEPPKVCPECWTEHNGECA